MFVEVLVNENRMVNCDVIYIPNQMINVLESHVANNHDIAADFLTIVEIDSWSVPVAKRICIRLTDESAVEMDLDHDVEHGAHIDESESIPTFTKFGVEWRYTGDSPSGPLRRARRLRRARGRSQSMNIGEDSDLVHSLFLEAFASMKRSKAPQHLTPAEMKEALQQVRQYVSNHEMPKREKKSRRPQRRPWFERFLKNPEGLGSPIIVSIKGTYFPSNPNDLSLQCLSSAPWSSIVADQSVTFPCTTEHGVMGTLELQTQQKNSRKSHHSGVTNGKIGAQQHNKGEQARTPHPMVRRSSSKPISHINAHQVRKAVARQANSGTVISHDAAATPTPGPAATTTTTMTDERTRLTQSLLSELEMLSSLEKPADEMEEKIWDIEEKLEVLSQDSRTTTSKTRRKQKKQYKEVQALEEEERTAREATEMTTLATGRSFSCFSMTSGHERMATDLVLKLEVAQLDMRSHGGVSTEEHQQGTDVIDGDDISSVS